MLAYVIAWFVSGKPVDNAHCAVAGSTRVSSCVGGWKSPQCSRMKTKHMHAAFVDWTSVDAVSKNPLTIDDPSKLRSLEIPYCTIRAAIRNFPNEHAPAKIARVDNANRYLCIQ